MADDQFILGGTGTDVFSGIPVSNFQASLDWYQRLFGTRPAFFPNETEAVWAIGDRRWIYIIVDAKRAGGAIQTIMSADLEGMIAQISGRGLDFGQEEIPGEGVRKVMYYDPDGNEIGLGRIPAE
ncbi:VOC family protein [Devosia sp. Root635]|uniref:VOC family protein n=1 Tax=Devosia sp. Root635 TaxID=1736575 RepID=UPI0006F55D4E|nr:glyoxalase/bleomycin resistance/dioxygenase family protein [Devosia sp. Root635]KRA42148.1 glyoxalase [Devosia sp. Root635]